MAQLVKNPPAMRESWVQSLGWEDPLEEGVATHSSILAWRIPMDRGAWWVTVHGIVKSWTRPEQPSTAQHRRLRTLVPIGLYLLSEIEVKSAESKGAIDGIRSCKY